MQTMALPLTFCQLKRGRAFCLCWSPMTPIPPWFKIELLDPCLNNYYSMLLLSSCQAVPAFDQVNAEYLCSNSYFIHFRLSDCLPQFLTGIPFITSGISLIFDIWFSTRSQSMTKWNQFCNCFFLLFLIVFCCFFTDWRLKQKALQELLDSFYAVDDKI